MHFDGNLDRISADTHSEPAYPPTPGSAYSLAHFYKLPADHTLSDLARAWRDNPQPNLLGPDEDGEIVNRWAEDTIKKNPANDN